MAEISGGPRSRGPVVAVVLVLLAVVAGGVVGLELGRRHAARTSAGLAAAAPVPGSSPSYPQWVPYAADSTDPPLATHLGYVHQWIDQGENRWSVDLPAGWVIVKDNNIAKMREARFAPAGAIDAGYTLRVERLEDPKLTPTQMRDAEIAKLQGSGYQDFEVFRKDYDSVGFTYRTPPDSTLTKPNLHRWNIFEWVTPPDKDAAGLEISVAGRSVDQAGLNDLLNKVADSAHPSPE